MKYSSRTCLDKYNLMIYHQQAWCLTGYYASVVGMGSKRSPKETAERSDSRTYLDKCSLIIYHQQAWCLTRYYISVIGIIP